MKPVLTLVFAGLSLSALLLASAGCEKAPEAPRPAPAASAAQKPHDHTSGDGHMHDHDHDHGPMTDLGEQTAGGLTVKASRAAEIKPGAEAIVDIAVTGASKIAAVRLWVGTQDAKGSMRAKADREKDGWHAHAEVPNPLPPGSKLWIEVDPEVGEKVVVGFDLKL